MIAYRVPPQSVDAAGLAPEDVTMAQQGRRGPWAPGRKIVRWLEDQRRLGLDPASQNALARTLGITQPIVWRWCVQGQRMKADQAAAVARLMGVSADYLLDEYAPYPPSDHASIRSVLNGLPEPERTTWLAILDDPTERAYLLRLRASHPRGAPRKR